MYSSVRNNTLFGVFRHSEMDMQVSKDVLVMDGETRWMG